MSPLVHFIPHEHNNDTFNWFKIFQTGICIYDMGERSNTTKAVFLGAGEVCEQTNKLPNVASASSHMFQKMISEKWLKQTTQYWKMINYMSVVVA